MVQLWVVFLITRLIPAWSQPPLPTAIFLLAGQSNMAGRGGVTNDTITHNLTWDGFIPSQCSSLPSILRLSSDLTWVQAHEPLHSDIDFLKTNGIGPGMPFSHNLILIDKSIAGAVIGLVPSAIGGTSIREWQKGLNLYNHLLMRAKAALQSGGVIKALLWYQGESDTVDQLDSQLYGQRLKRFFTDIRSDLNSPWLPIIQVGIASGNGPYIEGIRRSQFGINLPNVWTVDAWGLPLEPDGLHLTTPAQVQLGGLLADAFHRYPSDPLATSLTNTAPTLSLSSFGNLFIFTILTIVTMVMVGMSFLQI